MLQIDKDGAHSYILSLFPSTACGRPFHWEVKHLSTAEREGCMERLTPFGYRFAPSGGEDMLAVNF